MFLSGLKWAWLFLFTSLPTLSIRELLLLWERGAPCNFCSIVCKGRKSWHKLGILYCFSFRFSGIGTVAQQLFFSTNESSHVHLTSTVQHEVKSLSRVRLSDPMDCSLPGSSVHRIFQATVLEWIAISFSRRSSRPRDRTGVSRIVDRRFTVWATRETTVQHSKLVKKNNKK